MRPCLLPPLAGMLLLAGCSYLGIEPPANPFRPEVAPTSPPAATKATPATPPATTRPPAAHRQVKPVATPAELVGLDEAEVRNLLGNPAEARSEGAARILSYRNAQCALDVILFLDVKAGDLRVLSYQLNDTPRPAAGPACYDGLRGAK